MTHGRRLLACRLSRLGHFGKERFHAACDLAAVGLQRKVAGVEQVGLDVP